MDDRALRLLRRHGKEPGAVLGAGMEGTVIDLAGDEVAKVWHGRTAEDLALLLRFGAALGQSPIPFRTSRAIELSEGDDFTITTEQKVHGGPLRPDHVTDPPVATAEEARLMGDALAGLSRATRPELTELPILPTEPAFRGDGAFAVELAELTQRRFQANPDPLRRAIDDIDDLVKRLVAALRGLPPSPSVGLVHGDLIPANVLVADGEVAGVVDFGFLTTLGDPHFDAAITASVFDMYGANARQSEQVLSTAFTARFAHDPSNTASTGGPTQSSRTRISVTTAPTAISPGARRCCDAPTSKTRSPGRLDLARHG